MSIYNIISNVLIFKSPREQLKEHSKEINEQILHFNTLRIRIILTLLFIINIILLLFDLLYFRNSWAANPAYKDLFYLHVILFPPVILFIILYRVKTFKPSVYGRFNLCFSLIIIIWSQMISFNSQRLHGQISSYVICLFCFSSLLILTPVQRFTIIPFSYVVFLTGLLLSSGSRPQLFENIINSFFLFVISLLVSAVGYCTFSKHVINERIIALKNKEIDALNNELIKKVQSQTDELVKINSDLELEKLRASLFANISHEFKTPINVILSAEQLLEYKLKDDITQIPVSCIKKYMSSIKQNCYRLMRLVSNLIDINTIDCGNMGLCLGNRDIVKTAEDIVLCVAEFIKNKNISLIFDTQMEEKIIAIDVDKIERVLLNLLSNAIKFTPQNGSIYVNLYEENNNVMISIKDTGIGIPKEMQAAVFDRFVQVDRSFTKCSEGSGIGLSLVKSILEIHKGKIYVNSHIGEGSEFIIELPAYTIDVAKEEASATNEDQKMEKIKIEFSDIYL